MYAAEEVLDHAHTQNNRHFCRRMTAERRVGVVLSWACTGYNQGGGAKKGQFYNHATYILRLIYKNNEDDF